MTAPDFTPYCFPVVRVRFAGPTDYKGSRWIASMRRDNERTYRATTSYDYAKSSGASNAISAARACYAKALKDMYRSAGEPAPSIDDYVAIPGDLSADAYAFTFVPTYFFQTTETEV